MKSKHLIGVLVFCLTLSISGLAYAANFTDIAGHWAESQIEKMVASEAVYGYPDGTFKPDGKVTRAEFATIVNKAFDKFDESAQASFSDVSETDWFYAQVASGKAAGYISGYPDNTFRPGASISRAEAAVILAKIAKLDASKTDTADSFKDAGDIATWAKGSIAAVVKAKVMAGYPDGTFAPGDAITRAEAVTAISKALNPDVDSTSGGGGGGSHSSGGGGSGGGTTIVYLSEIKAVYDGMLTTKVSFKCDSAVKSVDVYDGANKILTGTPENGTGSWDIIGPEPGDVLTLKAYSSTNALLKSEDVTVVSAAQTPVEYITNAKATFDGLLMTNITANLSAAVTRVAIYKGENLILDTEASGNFDKSVIGAAVGDVLTLKAYAGDTMAQSVSVTVQDAVVTPPASTEYITNLSAKFDGMLITNVTANLDSSVTKVQIYKGTEKLCEAPSVSGGSISIPVIGAPAKTVLKVVAYSASSSQEASVTVE